MYIIYIYVWWNTKADNYILKQGWNERPDEHLMDNTFNA